MCFTRTWAYTYLIIQIVRSIWRKYQKCPIDQIQYYSDIKALQDVFVTIASCGVEFWNLVIHKPYIFFSHGHAVPDRRSEHNRPCWWGSFLLPANIWVIEKKRTWNCHCKHWGAYSLPTLDLENVICSKTLHPNSCVCRNNGESRHLSIIRK